MLYHPQRPGRPHGDSLGPRTLVPRLRTRCHGTGTWEVLLPGSPRRPFLGDLTDPPDLVFPAYPSPLCKRSPGALAPRPGHVREGPPKAAGLFIPGKLRAPGSLYLWPQKAALLSVPVGFCSRGQPGASPLPHDGPSTCEDANLFPSPCLSLPRAHRPSRPARLQCGSLRPSGGLGAAGGPPGPGLHTQEVCEAARCPVQSQLPRPQFSSSLQCARPFEEMSQVRAGAEQGGDGGLGPFVRERGEAGGAGERAPPRAPAPAWLIRQGGSGPGGVQNCRFFF